MMASSIVKLAGNLGQALFDGRPVFSATETIDFDTPGAPIAEAEFRVLCNPSFDASEFRFIPRRGLVANETVYDGPEPYIVISLDGKKRPELESFTATAASAAVMQKFFNLKDGAEAAIDALVEGMKLFNDSRFRAQVDAIDKKLAGGIDPNSAEGKELAERRQALAANILNDLMKPK